MQYKKYKKNQAGMNLTPPPLQNYHVVRWHCTAESERRVAEEADLSVVARLISKLATEFRKEDATRGTDWTQRLKSNWLKNVMSLDV